MFLLFIYFFPFTFLFQCSISSSGCLNYNKVPSPYNFPILMWLSLLMLCPIIGPFIFRIQRSPCPVVTPDLLLCTRCISPCRTPGCCPHTLHNNIMPSDSSKDVSNFSVSMESVRMESKPYSKSATDWSRKE